MEIPELEFELGMAVLGGKFTTLEGLLKDIRELVSPECGVQLGKGLAWCHQVWWHMPVVPALEKLGQKDRIGGQSGDYLKCPLPKKSYFVAYN